jgi:hypothetical protein
MAEASTGEHISTIPSSSMVVSPDDFLPEKKSRSGAVFAAPKFFISKRGRSEGSTDREIKNLPILDICISILGLPKPVKIPFRPPKPITLDKLRRRSIRGVGKS